MLNIKSPLREVLEFEKALPNLCSPELNRNKKVRVIGGKALRLEILGLPGIGKSSLRRGLAQLLHERGFSILVIPEAADYAVLKENLTLDNFSPFLDRVYDQAEELAVQAVKKNQETIIIKEPSRLQNKLYKDIKKALITVPGLRQSISEIYLALLDGEKYDKTGDSEFNLLWHRVSERSSDYSSFWNTVYFYVSTGESIADIKLSRKRQEESGRYDGLVTTDLERIVGYHLVIEKLWAELNRSKDAFKLDPEKSAENLINQVYGDLMGKWIGDEWIAEK